MTSRVLPRAEWARLNGTEAETVWPHLPEHASVIVIERDGVIVGCQVLMNVLHAECLWIAESDRGKSSVARRLWESVKEQARGYGVDAIVTAATDDRVRGLLAHVGAKQLVGDHYVVSVKG